MVVTGLVLEPVTGLVLELVKVDGLVLESVLADLDLALGNLRSESTTVSDLICCC